MHTQDLLETQELYQAVSNNLSTGIFLVDKEKMIQTWNEMAENITGYARYEMVDLNCVANLLDHIDDTGAPLCNNGYCPISATLEDGRCRTKELFIRHKRGYRVPVLCKTAPILQAEEITGAMITFVNNSVQLRENNLVSALTKLMTTDQLTGLANKHYTETVLTARLEDLCQYETKISVLFINLDDFALCNDDYGFEIGNQMLLCLADTFRQCFRDTDFVGRWTGEEFVGIFEIKSAEHLRMLAEKIRNIIQNTELEYDGNMIRVTASMGATLAKKGDSAKQLIDRAASLMHVSKISGKNCVTIG